jgi:Fe2+ transport system protein B
MKELAQLEKKQLIQQIEEAGREKEKTLREKEEWGKEKASLLLEFKTKNEKKKNNNEVNSTICNFKLFVTLIFDKLILHFLFTIINFVFQLFLYFFSIPVPIT